jgi:hypothetical protein
MPLEAGLREHQALPVRHGRNRQELPERARLAQVDLRAVLPVLVDPVAVWVDPGVQPAAIYRRCCHGCLASRLVI